MTRRVYCDSSVLTARVLDESHSPEIRAALTAHVAAADALITSDLALVEVHQSLGRTQALTVDARVLATSVAAAMCDVATTAIGAPVISIACRLPDRGLRTLDAIHVATALVVCADVVLTRDRRMAEACEAVGLAVA